MPVPYNNTPGTRLACGRRNGSARVAHPVDCYPGLEYPVRRTSGRKRDTKDQGAGPVVGLIEEAGSQHEEQILPGKSTTYGFDAAAPEEKPRYRHAGL